MTRTRLWQYAILSGYLVITLAALVYTMTRAVFLPWPIISFSYGMMAPYQSTTPYNFSLEADVITADGRRHAVDLTPYYPTIEPEAKIRQYIPFTHWRSDSGAPAALLAQYQIVADQIWQRELARDPTLQHLELYWEQWPLSVTGFETYHVPLFTDRTLLVRSPA